MKVLVTGAAGCVGSLVVDALLKEGRHVIAADRPRAVGALEALAMSRKDDLLEVRPVDLTKKEDCARAMSGATGVIHTAAIVDIAMSFDALRPINLDAVIHLYEAARAANVRAFVHFSTGSVYAPRSDGGAYDEKSLVTAGNAYVRTKLLSEDYLRSRPRQGGPHIAMVRPSLIFGPRGKVLAATLAAVPGILGRSLPFTIALEGGPRSNWVHALDVARAAVFLLDNEAPHGEVYNVANDDALPIGDLVTTAFRLSGWPVRGPRIPYPTSIVRAISPLIDSDQVFGAVNRAAVKIWDRVRADHVLEAELIPRIDREALPYAFRDCIFANHKLRSLGFQLKHADFESGWADTIAWYESARWIPVQAGLGERKLGARVEVAS